jgi:hypothetical protein
MADPASARRVTSDRKRDPKAKPPGGLSGVELHALAIVGKEAKKWRDVLEPGPGQAIDLVVRITGHVDVAQDQTATVKLKPELELVLAHVLGALGKKTRQLALDTLVAAFVVKKKPKKAVGKKPTDLIAATAEPPAGMRALALSTIELLTRSTKQTRAGNVSGRLEVARCG